MTAATPGVMDAMPVSTGTVPFSATWPAGRARWLFVNPFVFFSLGMSVAIFLYLLKLSHLYEQVLPGVFWLTCLLTFISLVFSYFFWLFVRADDGNSDNDDMSSVNTILLSGLIACAFFLEVSHFGSVPLLRSLRGLEYSYVDFGIPSFHVLVVSYYSAFAIVSFYRVMRGYGKVHLLGVLTGLVFSALIMNRGAVVMICLACALVYLYLCKRLFLSLFIAAVCALLMTVAFGYAGDKRMVSSGYTSEQAIYTVGQADDVFLESNMPSGFFWVYLYISSPMANLINQDLVENTDRGDIVDLIGYSIFPDFISKRLMPEVPPVETKLITPELTVSTVFGLPIVILGYLGILIVFFWYTFLVSAFSALNKNGLIAPVCAILSSMSALMAFDNMMVFASIIMQLILITLLSRFRIGGFRLI